MKTYSFSFEGRQAGAIGIFYRINDAYKAKDIHEAMSLVYEDYEHFKGLTVNENGKSIDIPKDINWVKVRSNRERERDQKTGTYK